MPGDFTAINHYVPQWYQKRFIPDDRKDRKYHYLDMAPERVQNVDGTGFHVRNERRYLGPASCFQQQHLYTMFFGGNATDVIEKKFFGEIDSIGATALELFLDYDWTRTEHHTIHDFIDFIGAQKLRTPKGLDYLKYVAKGATHQQALVYMQKLQQVYVTMWMESVWEVLCCDNSSTKFIVSDHPVAAYNKGFFPLCEDCTYPKDAPIDCLGTHTIFPLSLNRCLVITNLGYVRDPSVNPCRRRENARAYENTMFDMREIQTGRQLSERDVQAINFIMKKRARRFVAAAEKEWLHPEKHFSRTMWNKLGDQFFLMPDPRKMRFTTDTVMGYKGGGSFGVDEYGRQPNRKDAAVIKLREKEWTAFLKHQKLWESKFGQLSREELRAIWI
jgi:hypothetical protein